MKKLLSLSAILFMSIILLTGCTININTNDSTNEKNNNEGVTTTTTTTSVSEDTTTKVSGMGEKYVDYDNRTFSVSGKIYTLGKSTLQDMIDDGVPFDKNDIANASNNLNKNTESQSFKIVLGEYYTAQVRVINDSNDNKKISECKLSSIYLPINLDKTQNILSFAFPLTISEDELTSNAGKPSNTNEYKGDNNYVSNKYEYKKDSKKYYGSSGYTFQFVNGKLRYITITYKP